MTQEEYFEQYTYPKILLPSIPYDLSKDKRLLIPFAYGNKIGFYDHIGDVIVKPKYSMYYGECLSDTDNIIVSIPWLMPKSEGVSKDHLYYLYGVLNSKGEEVLPVEYRRLIPAIGNRNLFSAQNKKLQHGVITLQGEVLVPFGKYEWISGFDRGLARVKADFCYDERISLSKWGLINEKGVEVLHPKYKHIEDFYGQNAFDVRVYNDDWDGRIFFCDFNKDIPCPVSEKVKKEEERGYGYNDYLSDIGASYD